MEHNIQVKGTVLCPHCDVLNVIRVVDSACNNQTIKCTYCGTIILMLIASYQPNKKKQ